MTDRVYVDANVIVYALDPDNPFHHRSAGFWRAVAAGGIPAAVSPQVLHEAFVALTRRTARPLDARIATGLLTDVLATPGLALLTAGTSAVAEALRLAGARDIRGPAIYDIAHVAVMREHDLHRIVTFNRRHFEGYEGVQPVEPAAE
jgi:predicted nucleic acid-binding protein